MEIITGMGVRAGIIGALDISRGPYVHNWLERSITQVHNSKKIFIGRLKLPMELWCVSDGAAFASKLAVCPITSTPPLTG